MKDKTGRQPIPDEVQLISDHRLNVSGLDVSPETVRRFGLGNNYARTYTLLHGLTDNASAVIHATPAGALKVANVGAGLTSYEVLTGTAADAYTSGNTLTLASAASRFDILVETNDAIVSFRNELNTAWQTDIILPVGFFSLDFASIGVQIKNRTAGSNAVYQVVAYT